MGQTLSGFDYCKKMKLNGWKSYQLDNKVIHELMDVYRYLSKENFEDFRFLIKNNKTCNSFYKVFFTKEDLSKMENHELIQKFNIKEAIQEQKTKDELIGFEMIRPHDKNIVMVTKDRTGILINLVTQDVKNLKKSESYLKREVEKNGLNFEDIYLDLPFKGKKKSYFVSTDEEPTVDNVKNFITNFDEVSKTLTL